MNPALAFIHPEEPLSERQRWRLPLPLQHYLGEAMEDWRREGKTRRLWDGDAALWTSQDEANWLGWLKSPEEELAEIDGLQRVITEIQATGFEQVLLLGMGGSSLCPEVLARTFGRLPLQPQLLVLDSTDPEQIRRVAARLDLRRTLFIVSSKSGTTLEPNLLKEFFYQAASQAVGPDLVGSRFLAITDPNSPLQQMAEAQHFRHVFAGAPDIGGRYSALSNFGMVPGLLMGLDIGTFLVRALEMVHACCPSIPLEENPGVMLGLILGVAGNHGRDKITLVASPAIRSLGAWIEQLLAESTGKAGKGLIPVPDEDLAAPSLYGSDRLFCYLRHREAPDLVQDAKMETLEQWGQPVVRIELRDKYDLGQEFFRWEFATATAGSVLGINPFDQPDVEASKVAARQLMADYEAKGSLPAQSPLLTEEGLTLLADPHNAGELTQLAYGQRSLEALLGAHLQRLELGDYFALLAFMEMNEEHQAGLETIRTLVRDRCGVATCLGFGPRYLHSTGQAHKGGPNTGVFLELTCDPPADLCVPGHRYTFGVVESAQALGDFKVLAERGRRLLRVHLGRDVRRGLATLRDQVIRALK